MYPEAGGSSSFARHAFNEFWSFFAAWAQMLNYIDHDRHLGVLRAALPRRAVLGRRCATRPGDIFFGIGVVVAAVRGQRRRRQGVGRRQHRAGGHRLRDAAAARARRRGPRLLARRRWSTTSTSASRRRWKDFFLAIPVGDDRLHGHRDDLEHGRGGQGRDEDDPGGDQPRRDRRVRDLRAAARRRAERAAGRRRTPTASYQTLLGLPEDAGRLRRRPDPRRRQADRPRARSSTPARSTSACSPRRSCSSPPTPGIIGVSRLVYSMGLHRQVPDRLRQLHPKYGTPWIGILLFGAIACVTMIPGKAEFLGQHVRVRRDAVVHDRAPRGDPRCASTQPDHERPYRGPGNIARRAAASCRCSRSLGGDRHAAGVRRRHVPAPRRRGRRRRLAGARHASSTSVYRRRQGLDLTTTIKVAIPRPVVEHEAEYESVLVALDAAPLLARARSRPRPSSPRAGGAASTCS